MKTTSKRKRSPKPAPVVDGVAPLEAAPAAASVEPAPVAVIATESANEPVVAEASAEASVPVVAEASEPVVAEANEPVVAEAIEPAVAEAHKPAAAIDPVIVLAANCSVKDAAALKTSLCAVAKEIAAVTLDTSAVERVDTATMQLLCAFVRDRIARKQSIVWRGESQVLQDAARLLGVGALLGFEGVAA